MKKKRYYICHPFETYGEKKENLKKEDDFVKSLRQVYGADKVEFVRPFKEVNHDLPREEAMDQCLDLLSTCDGIILAPDWNRSEGCQVEYEEALDNGFDIIEIKKWLN